MPGRVSNLYAAIYGLALLSLQAICCVLCRREVFILLLKVAEYTQNPRLFMAIELIDDYGNWLASYLEVALAYFPIARSYSLKLLRMSYQSSLELLASSEEQLHVTAQHLLEGGAVDLARQVIRSAYYMAFHGIESAVAVYRVTSSLYVLMEHLVTTSPYFETIVIAGK